MAFRGDNGICSRPYEGHGATSLILLGIDCPERPEMMSLQSDIVVCAVYLEVGFPPTGQVASGREQPPKPEDTLHRTGGRGGGNLTPKRKFKA